MLCIVATHPFVLWDNRKSYLLSYLADLISTAIASVFPIPGCPPSFRFSVSCHRSITLRDHDESSSQICCINVLDLGTLNKYMNNET